jgi:hypothetical protein
MRRVIGSVVAGVALVGLGLFGVAALASVHTRAHRFASCHASGDYATCVAAGTAKRPLVIRVHVSASPRQPVYVAWSDTCSKGFGAGSKSGHFTTTTPIHRKIRHPYRRPDSCIVSADGQLQNGGNHIHIWLTATRW